MLNFTTHLLFYNSITGNAYTLRHGTQWHRVLIDKNGKHAFFVDIGNRIEILPEMVFHRLPDRYHH